MSSVFEQVKDAVKAAFAVAAPVQQGTIADPAGRGGTVRAAWASRAFQLAVVWSRLEANPCAGALGRAGTRAGARRSTETKRPA